ncbi:hypothetical protein IM816_05715 [Luteibacter flocculans]|uniref:Uncharacterized protein n=1 Tax=Luteibacter flocculans TaxID=2780091 RepID=A0ABY4T6R1_9GAMM|nr:hypothetical protein [Luteibacter flocculans]URL59593.1 hypothetical protein IM816_05715 [Luteibacter flocculans]
MGTNQHKPSHQVLAERAGALVKVVNNLIADIESDLRAPADAAFNARVAHRALQDAVLTLADSARDQVVDHYQQMAREAQQAAA